MFERLVNGLEVWVGSLSQPVRSVQDRDEVGL